ncbi:MAG: DUF1553 domain-containing protein [Verrucomicrobia bacterium]|nr:DUF1553 domain-containing protein [Verrucomicrobiota bacterium]
MGLSIQWAVVAGLGALQGLVLGASGPDYLLEVKPLFTTHCVSCHGSVQAKGGLRLDTAQAMRKGGRSGPAIHPRDARQSLLVQAAEGRHAEIPPMPYKKPRLSGSDLERIRNWIDSGAAAPADEPSGSAAHWAFLSVRRPPLPPVRDSSWSSNPIDRFILHRLESENITPSQPTEPLALLRRLWLDLTGLPPTADAITRFMALPVEQACREEVDRLLGSPHFGERWGRHWLDRARYADSNGYSVDAPRSMWRYRDWVLDAFNANLPFDRFMAEQLAGDLLPNAATAQQIATGFHRNTQINQEGGIDLEQFRIESIFDRVATTSTVFMGLTLSCAQCHDHKFDPFTQTDYFRLFALFNNVDEPSLEAPTPAEAAARNRHAEKLNAAEAELNTLSIRLDESTEAWERRLEAAVRDQLKPEVRKALPIPAALRGDSDWNLIRQARRADDPAYRRQMAVVEQLRKARPEVTTALVMSERKDPRVTHRLIKGDFTRPAEVVDPGVPASLPPLTPESKQANRLDLARWLARPDHPLTSRVAVNQVWMHLFGRGLVETENDFGVQGAPPTHPELLDWLASEFMTTGWDLKGLLRLLVTSSTYRQSSHLRSDLASRDPQNRWWARQNRMRLEAEIIRDTALASSGLLVPRVGGPSVHPPQPDGVMVLGQSRREWKTSSGADRFRRGLYTFYWRATPHPALAVFDAPDAFSACSRRTQSNTPLQALTLLNETQFHEMALELAKTWSRSSEGPASTLRHAFLACLGRPPTPEELSRLEALLSAYPTPASAPDESHRGWVAVARVLLNLDETVTRE